MWFPIDVITTSTGTKIKSFTINRKELQRWIKFFSQEWLVFSFVLYIFVVTNPSSNRGCLYSKPQLKEIWASSITNNQPKVWRKLTFRKITRSEELSHTTTCRKSLTSNSWKQLKFATRQNTRNTQARERVQKSRLAICPFSISRTLVKSRHFCSSLGD